MGTQFIEIEFPRTISAKAVGGPSFNTTINPGQSGYESRNQNWQIPRGEWTVTVETPSERVTTPLTYIEQLTAFFLVVGGKANAFRLKDHKDFTNGLSLQTIGAADGATGNFQLVKNYTVGPLTFQRTITKPITSLVVDYLNQALADSISLFDGSNNKYPSNAGYVGGGSSKYSLDETTGIACFGSATKMTITAVANLNGMTQYFYTLTHGVLPQRGQQVVVSGDGTSSHNGLWIIKQVQALTATTGWFTTNNTASGGGTGIAHIGWAGLAITGATSLGGGLTQYNYTKTFGVDPTIGQRANIFDMPTSANNGSGYITAVDIGGGTFTVSGINGSTQTESGTASTDWVPPSGAGFLTASYQYHMPVRFDTDDLQIQLEESDVVGGKPVVTWNAITLREVRIVPGQSNG